MKRLVVLDTYATLQYPIKIGMSHNSIHRLLSYTANG